MGLTLADEEIDYEPGGYQYCPGIDHGGGSLLIEERAVLDGLDACFQGGHDPALAVTVGSDDALHTCRLVDDRFQFLLGDAPT